MNTQEHQGKVNVGDKYHRLTAKKFISLVKRSQAMWLWVCDCGKEHLATAGGVKSGSTKSCGCYKLETVKKIHKTHGMFYTREYSSWGKMIQRCTNEKDKKFPRTAEEALLSVKDGGTHSRHSTLIWVPDLLPTTPLTVLTSMVTTSLVIVGGRPSKNRQEIVEIMS